MDARSGVAEAVSGVGMRELVDRYRNDQGQDPEEKCEWVAEKNVDHDIILYSITSCHSGKFEIRMFQILARFGI